MKVVIVGPVPGMAPNSVPTSVPRTIGKNACFSSARLGRMSRMRTLASRADVVHAVDVEQEVGDAEQAHAPAPPARRRRASSGKPKVKRCDAAVDVGPDHAAAAGRTSVIATPLSGEPRDMVAPASRPSSMIEKISVGPNLKAICTSSGEAKIITMMPNEAAKNDAIMVMPSAVPPLPCWVIG